MKVNEEGKLPIWEVETINNTVVTLKINREIFANEDGTEPVYLEMAVKQTEIVEGKEKVITIPVKINCSEADALGRHLISKVLPHYSKWVDTLPDGPNDK